MLRKQTPRREKDNTKTKSQRSSLDSPSSSPDLVAALGKTLQSPGQTNGVTTVQQTPQDPAKTPASPIPAKMQEQGDRQAVDNQGTPSIQTLPSQAQAKLVTKETQVNTCISPIPAQTESTINTM